MSNGVASVYARTEMDFIPPPQWGVWYLKPGGGGPFYVYKDLPLAKAAITSQVTVSNQRIAIQDVKIYRFEVGLGWVLYDQIFKDDNLKQHALWKKPGKRGPGTIEATENQVDEAMQSILTSIQNQEE